MSEKDNGDNGGSGQEGQPQSSEDQATPPREGYPPTSVHFEGDDAAMKSEKGSSTERVDLTETEDSDSDT